MYDHFKAISLSFKNAPIPVREAVSLDEDVIADLLKLLSEHFTDISEVLLVSTCNRTEVYYASPSDRFEDLVKLIGMKKNLHSPLDYAGYFKKYEQLDAVRHLFNVSMGLEAQVVGDFQIANQVKRAYQLSADAAMAGPFLHRLMHTIFYTNKRIVQETSFRDGAASVSYAAIELIEELTSHIVDPKILAIGLGEIGTDVCKSLATAQFKDVSISNRNGEKAQAVAGSCGFKVVEFENIHNAIREADVVVSSLSGDHFLIHHEFVRSMEIPGYKYFIDLGIPRSVEQSIENIPGVLLYNIDNIKSKTTEALRKRLSAIPDVKAIIDESIESFQSWSKEMEVSPTIKKLKEALEHIRKTEIARHLKDLDQCQSEKIDQITRSILQKIIKLPALQLKAACRRGDAENLIGVLNELFDLEKTEVKK